MQLPWQQSLVRTHEPPKGEHDDPDWTQMPLMHSPPEQQSDEVVHVPCPMGMQLAQTKPVPPGLGMQMWLQHSSLKAQVAPMGKHAPPKFAQQRDTPMLVFWHAALPPLQQFCEAPCPPHTSPSARQWRPAQRRRPKPSAAPHVIEQHCAFEVQISLSTRQPPMA
jgi:hypothetical protein